MIMREDLMKFKESILMDTTVVMVVVVEGEHYCNNLVRAHHL